MELIVLLAIIYGICWMIMSNKTPGVKLLVLVIITVINPVVGFLIGIGMFQVKKLFKERRDNNAKFGNSTL
jgi:multisubunit Na+/H+ antiporter MnhG subunit